MENMEYIKSSIKELYNTNPSIHISVSKTHPKVIVEKSPAKIIGVYKNIFQVEERESGRIPARHTFQYTDVLIGQVKIEELDGAPTVNILNQK